MGDLFAALGGSGFNFTGEMMDLPNQKRLAGFDVLRLLGALAVIWIHICDPYAPARRFAGYWVYWAVPIFVMISAFLTQKKLATSTENPGYTKILWGRIRRLVPAYLGWTLIYVLVRWGKHEVVGTESLQVDWLGLFLYGGAAMQLYFIPMLILFTVVFTPVSLGLLRLNRICQTAVLTGLLVIVHFGSENIHMREYLPDNLFYSYAWANAKFYVAGAVAFCIYNRSSGGAGSALGSVAGLGMFLYAGLFPTVAGFRVEIQSIGLLLFGCTLPWGGNRFFSLGAKWSFGIFLSHSLFSETLQFIISRLGIPLDRLSTTLTVFLVSALGSAILIKILLSSKWSRWLAG
jgi:peptidoglycan/LPS O-acetylase OafA/YrhL